MIIQIIKKKAKFDPGFIYYCTTEKWLFRHCAKGFGFCNSQEWETIKKLLEAHGAEVIITDKTECEDEQENNEEIQCNETDS